MDGYLGKIILYDDRRNPLVVISETDKVLKGLEIVKKDNDCMVKDMRSHFKLSNEELTKFKYKGKKISNPIVDLCGHRSVKNIQIREIGILSEDSYFRLLKEYAYYHAYTGTKNYCFLSNRYDVHNQLVKRMNK